MPAFFLTFLATALAIMAGRDAVRIARLSAAHGFAGVARAGVLYAAIVLAGVAYAALAAWLAGGLADMLQGAAGRLFVAVALGIAGFEVLVLRPKQAPTEPTRSLGATLIVLLAALATGAAGFLVLALTVMTGAPVLAGAGGALGAVAALSGAAMAGEDWEKLPHGAMRLGGGATLLAAALVTGYLALTSA